MKIEHLFLFIIYLFSYQTSLSQQNPTDSLESLLPQTTKVNDKVILYEALIVNYEEKEPHKVVEYSNQLLKLLEQNAYETRGDIYNYLGLAYKKLVQNNKAISCFDSAIHCFEYSNSSEKIIDTKSNKWQVYRHLTIQHLYKDPDKAIEYAELLLKLARSGNDPDQVAMSYSLIGAINGIKHQTEHSFEYFDSAIYYYEVV
jgi:tetratricopeptide (TPR) repeat protein